MTKVMGYLCQWGGYAASEMAAVGKRELPAGFRYINLRCTGRVDPVHLVQALASGYQGVAVVGCERTICRYETGNFYAASRVAWVQSLLVALGFSPDRLTMGFANSEGRDVLKSFLEPYFQQVESLGPLGSGSGFTKEEVARRLTLAERVLQSRELRWCMGQEVVLARDMADCFGRPFNVEDFRQRAQAVLLNVLGDSKVMESLKDGSKALAGVAADCADSESAVLKRIVNLIAAGLVELETTENRMPIFKSLDGSA